MVKILKIAFGSMFAMIIAQLIGLDYPLSVGVITLLTIQDTVKETIKISLKRVSAFFVASVMVYILFNLLGYNLIVYGVFLFLFMLLCYELKLKDAIAMNSVLATHYLASGNMTLDIFVNELGLVLIGVGIGTLLNLYMPGDVKQIRKIQHELEEDLRTIFFRMSQYIVKEDKSDYTGECFNVIDTHIKNGLKHAYANMNNTFMQETQYFIDYMQMRKQQAEVLHDIYENIIKMEYVPQQAENVAEFFEHISRTFEESNNAQSLILECDELCEKFKQTELPKTKEEFESRAILYLILLDLKLLIKIKGDFAMSLTDKQIQTYWK